MLPLSPPRTSRTPPLALLSLLLLLLAGLTGLTGIAPWRTARALPLGGGGGFALQLNGKQLEVASALLSFSSPASSGTLEYYALSADASGSYLVVESRDAYAVPPARDNCLRPEDCRLLPKWTHFAHVYDADLKRYSIYRDGVNVVNRMRFDLVTTSQIQPLGGPGCLTTGGFVPENTPCTFPFKYDNRLFSTCADFTKFKPFVGDHPRPRLASGSTNQTLELPQEYWCATVSLYSDTNAKDKKKWGYCQCTVPYEVVEAESELPPDTFQVASFSSPASFATTYDVLNIYRASKIDYKGCLVIGISALSAPSVVVVTPPAGIAMLLEVDTFPDSVNRTKCNEYLLSRNAELTFGSQLKVLVFLGVEATVLSANPGGDGTNLTGGVRSKRMRYPPSVIGNANPTYSDDFIFPTKTCIAPDDDSRVFDPTSRHAFDQDLSTSWSGCTLTYAYTNPPSSTRGVNADTYSLVFRLRPSEFAAMSAVSWSLWGRLSSDSSGNGSTEMVPIDYRSAGSLNASSSRAVPSEDHVYVSFFFNISSSLNGPRFTAYELRFDNTACVKNLLEFGIFDFGTGDAAEAASQRLDYTSSASWAGYYFTIPTNNSTQSSLLSLALAVSVRTSAWSQLLSAVPSDGHSTYMRIRGGSNFVSPLLASGAATLTMGQVPVSRDGEDERFVWKRSFAGALDAVRFWSRAMSPDEVGELSRLAQGSTMAAMYPATDGAGFGFDDRGGDSEPWSSFRGTLAFGQLAGDQFNALEFVDGFSPRHREAEERVDDVVSSGLLSPFLPSRAPLLGGELVVVLPVTGAAPTSYAIVLTGYETDPTLKLLTKANVDIASKPSNGTLSNSLGDYPPTTSSSPVLPILLVPAWGIATVEYTPRGGLSWSGDSFSYTLSNNGVKASYVVRLIPEEWPVPFPKSFAMAGDEIERIFFLGGALSPYDNSPLTVRLQGLSGIGSGASLSLLTYDSAREFERAADSLHPFPTCDSLLENTVEIVVYNATIRPSSYLMPFAGVVGLRYRVSSGSTSTVAQIDTFTWSYVSNPGPGVPPTASQPQGSATVEMVLAPRAVPSTLTLVTPLNNKIAPTDRLTIKVKTTSVPGESNHLMILTPPRAGSLLLSTSGLGTSVLFTTTRDSSSSRASGSPQSHFITEILRYSSTSTANVAQQTCVGVCESWYADADGCLACRAALASRAPSPSSSSTPANTASGLVLERNLALGAPDGRLFRFSERSRGFEFIEARFVEPLVNVDKIVVHQSVAGHGALFRISLAVEYDANDAAFDCGGWTTSTPSVLTLPAFTGESRLCRPNQPVVTGPQTSCGSRASLTEWITVWSDRCSVPRHPPSSSSSSSSTGGRIFATEYAACVKARNVAFSAIRLDFDTRVDPRGSPGVDSVEAVTDTSLEAGGVLVPDWDDSIHSLVYVPDDGIFGNDALELSSASVCSGDSLAPTVRVAIEVSTPTSSSSSSPLTPFVALPDIVLSNFPPDSNGIVHVPLIFDWVPVLDDLASRFFGVERASAIAWSPRASLSILLSPPSVSAPFSVPDMGTTVTIPISSATSNHSRVYTLQITLAALRAMGDLPIQLIATVTSQDFLPGVDPITHLLGMSIFKGCDNLIRELGPCSSYRPIAAGVCTKIQTTGTNTTSTYFTCVCPTIKLPGTSDSDPANIIVTGASCEFTTLDTCHGRGHPDAFGVCDCFPDKFGNVIFGGPTCEKRVSPISDVSELVDEVDALAKRILSAMLLAVPGYRATTTIISLGPTPIVGNSSSSSSDSGIVLGGRRRLERELAAAAEAVVLPDPPAPNDTGDNVTTPFTTLVCLTLPDFDDYMMTCLNATAEASKENSCNGNGIPTRSGSCNCQFGFIPPSTCLIQSACQQAGQYLIPSSGCADCPVGSYCPNGIDVIPCPNDTFSLRPGGSKCVNNCVDDGFPGHFVVRDPITRALSCSPCQPGYSCSDGVNATLCDVGTFAPDVAMLQCLSCADIGDVFYSDTQGATRCKSCPANSYRLFGSPGENATECVCKPGFWNNSPGNVTLSGVPCVTCPENAICVGSWSVESSAALVNASSTASIPSTSPTTLRRRRRLRRGLAEDDGTTLSPTLPPGVPVIYENAPPYPVEGYWGDPQYPTEFFSCQLNHCVGGANYTCANGYTGRFCMSCAPGYHDVGGDCFKCPGGDLNYVMIVFGVALILLAFALLNRASSEVQALDVALLYAQVANLVQQFDMYWPYPVSLLTQPYQVTDFDVDFINRGCIERWTFLDKFYVQFFLLWIVGAGVTGINLCAFFYARYHERRAKKKQLREKEKERLEQSRRVARVAARVAMERLKRHATSDSPSPRQGNSSPRELGEAGSPRGAIGDLDGRTTPTRATTPPTNNASPRHKGDGSTTRNLGEGEGESARMFTSAVSLGPEETPAARSASGGTPSSKMAATTKNFVANVGETAQEVEEDFLSWFKGCRRFFTRLMPARTKGLRRGDTEELDQPGSGSAMLSSSSTNPFRSQSSRRNVVSLEDEVDPRWRAIKSWIRKTMGFPKTHAEYKSYTNSQLAGFLNLMRIVYNSVVLICLNTFGCIQLADGTSVVMAQPDLVCFSGDHVPMLALGVVGVVLYGFGIPALFYVILTRASKLQKKADPIWFERFGFLYEGYHQETYRWELMILFRRASMCLLVVFGNGNPYVQAIFGGLIIVGCLGVHLYWFPYLTWRINVLETIALSSIFFYILCGVVFTALRDARVLNPDGSYTSNNDFSTQLSWILFIVSLSTIAACFYIFLQDLRDFFRVLLAERSLLVRARSDDVGLIRVLRANYENFSADQDLARQWKTVMHSSTTATRKRIEVKSSETGENRAYAAFKRIGAALGLLDNKKNPSSPPPDIENQIPPGGKVGVDAGGVQSQSSSARLRTRRSSIREMMSPLGLGVSSKMGGTGSTLFESLDKDGSKALSKEELIEYARSNLGLDSDSALAAIDAIFEKYDVDLTGSIDMNEFAQMISSKMPDGKEAELRNTIKSKYLIRWANSPDHVNPMMVALFFELDEMVRDIVSDEAIVSAYRDNSTAKFYRQVAEAFPFLADWAASAKQEDVEAFHRILLELNSVKDTVGSRGTFSQMTVEIDRAPIIFWLVQASQRERLVFRTVYASICAAYSHGGRPALPIWQRLKSGGAVRDSIRIRRDSLRGGSAMGLGGRDGDSGAPADDSLLLMGLTSEDENSMRRGAPLGRETPEASPGSTASRPPTQRSHLSLLMQAPGTEGAEGTGSPREPVEGEPHKTVETSRASDADTADGENDGEGKNGKGTMLVEV